jgi:hypothetical protein
MLLEVLFFSIAIAQNTDRKWATTLFIGFVICLHKSLHQITYKQAPEALAKKR